MRQRHPFSVRRKMPFPTTKSADVGNVILFAVVGVGSPVTIAYRCAASGNAVQDAPRRGLTAWAKRIGCDLILHQFSLLE
jgi:hypothetical protein